MPALPAAVQVRAVAKDAPCVTHSCPSVLRIPTPQCELPARNCTHATRAPPRLTAIPLPQADQTLALFADFVLRNSGRGADGATNTITALPMGYRSLGNCGQGDCMFHAVNQALGGLDTRLTASANRRRSTEILPLPALIICDTCDVVSGS